MHVAGRDRRVAALAAQQHGVVASRQLAAAALGRRAVAHRVAQGRLTRLHRGVYLLGPLKAQLTDAMAAVLACGDGAVLSHHAAAALHGFRAATPGPIDVTVPARNARARPGIRVHRVRQLAPAEVTRRQGIPVTTPERTLLDLAAVLPQKDLERTLQEAEVQRLLSLPLDEQYACRRGAKALRAAARKHDGPALTRSEAEARVLALVEAARLPRPAANARLHRYEVDLLWRAERLVVEVDGYAFHSTRAAFERDRRRDAELQTAGYRVLRVTWRQIVEEPEALVATLSVALRR
jgi:very-short-patch-repair endonuclease